MDIVHILLIVRFQKILRSGIGLPCSNVVKMTRRGTGSFQTRYAVAIEFLDLKPFDKKAVSHPDDLIAQFVLAALIAQEDRIQLKVVDNHIVFSDKVFGEFLIL